MTTKERWILSEFCVARDRTHRLGEELLGHRVRTPFAEIDLIFKPSARQVLIVEVKTVTENWDVSFLSRRQLARLLAARTYIEEEFTLRASLLLALVSIESRSIRYVEPAF